MSQRWLTTQLACGNPSVRLSPLPTSSGTTLQPFPQICGGHRINIDADILGEETPESLQSSALKIAINVFKRSNHERETYGEAHRRPGMAVYQGCHVVELTLPKKQHVTAGREKRVDTAKQVRNFRGRLVWHERSNC